MQGPVRYRFLSVIGEGGFGRVYRARLETDHGFHKDVAIKVLIDPDPPASVLQRHRDEARILGLVRDRAVVNVDPPLRVSNRWAIVMGLVDGASCGTLLARTEVGVFPPGVAVEIVGEVARALHNLFHMEGPSVRGNPPEPLQVLHRDIKPDNVQITPTGEVLLLDFSIARAEFPDREFATEHTLGGTPGYIAPERLHGIEGPQSDVYSLGVLLHELVVGRRPEGVPTAVSGLGEHVALVVALAGRMHQTSPEGRPTAREVERQCRSLRQRLPPPDLRDWAEERVSARPDMPGDALCGQVVTVTGLQTQPDPPSDTGDAPALPRRTATRVAAVGFGAALMIAGVWAVSALQRVIPEAPPALGSAGPTLPTEAPALVHPAPRSEETPPQPAPPEPIRPPPALQAARIPVPAGPPEASVAPVSLYEVTFTSIPLGASVEVLEQREGQTAPTLGRTPLRRGMPAGTYVVRMTREDGQTTEQTLRVGRTMPTRYLWRSMEDRWEVGY